MLLLTLTLASSLLAQPRKQISLLDSCQKSIAASQFKVTAINRSNFTRSQCNIDGCWAFAVSAHLAEKMPGMTLSRSSIHPAWILLSNKFTEIDDLILRTKFFAESDRIFESSELNTSFDNVTESFGFEWLSSYHTLIRSFGLLEQKDIDQETFDLFATDVNFQQTVLRDLRNAAQKHLYEGSKNDDHTEFWPEGLVVIDRTIAHFAGRSLFTINASGKTISKKQARQLLALAKTVAARLPETGEFEGLYNSDNKIFPKSKDDLGEKVWGLGIHKTAVDYETLVSRSQSALKNRQSLLVHVTLPYILLASLHRLSERDLLKEIYSWNYRGISNTHWIQGFAKRARDSYQNFQTLIYPNARDFNLFLEQYDRVFTLKNSSHVILAVGIESDGKNTSWIIQDSAFAGGPDKKITPVKMPSQYLENISSVVSFIKKD